MNLRKVQRDKVGKLEDQPSIGTTMATELHLIGVQPRISGETAIPLNGMIPYYQGTDPTPFRAGMAT